MGRYTNVQSYADNSPSMRTVSYAQATGRTATATATATGTAAATATASADAAASDSPSHDTARNNEVQSQPSSRSSGKKGEGNMTSESCTDKATKSKPTKSSNDNTEEEPQQTRERSAISPSSCDTNSLFVGGLHPRIGDLHLRKLFSPYGEITRINIVTHNPSMNKPDSSSSSKSHVHSKPATSAKYVAGLQQSKGFAFVEYSSIESARLAISRLDGRKLMDRTLAVRPSRRKMSDIANGRVGSGDDSKVTAEEARREYGAVQSKIEAVKRAIEQKKKGM